MLANTVANVANVANLSVMSDNVMPTVSPQQACIDTAFCICMTETNSGVSQNVPQNVSQNPFQNVSQKMPQNVPIVDMPLMPVMSCPPQSETAHSSSISSYINLPKQVPVTQTQLPTVVVRPPTAPKFYKGDTSYKAYKEYFECLSVCNRWVTNLEKAQNLLISLEGPAADTVQGFEVKQDSDYDTIWELLKNDSHMLMTPSANVVFLTPDAN